MRSSTLGFLLPALILCSAAAPAAAGPGEWSRQFYIRGISGIGRTLAVQGDQLVLGGSFSAVADVPTANLARWDGYTWEAVEPPQGGSIFQVWSLDGVLYANVYTSGIGNQLAANDGTGWEPVPGVLDGSLQAVVPFEGNLAIATSAAKVFLREGNSWRQLGSSTFDRRISHLAVYEGRLIATAGPDFPTWPTGIVPLRGAVFWDGEAWQPVGGGFDGAVTAVAMHDGRLAVSSVFGEGSTETDILQWDGTAWTRLGSRIPGSVQALADHRGILYAGGVFQDGSGRPSNVAAWDGSAWISITRDGGRIDAMISYRNHLVVTGSCTSMGLNERILCYSIAAWDGTNWSALAPRNPFAVEGIVGADVLRGFEGNLVVGGDFGYAGNRTLADLCRLAPYGWESQGRALGNKVNALEELDGNLVALGYFNTGWPSFINRVAWLDGDGWRPFGNGFDGSAWAAAIYRGDLVAGGYFDWSGDGSTSLSKVARWSSEDGAWLPLGSGIEDSHSGHPVLALTEYDGYLIAGGRFESASDPFLLNIALWDGTSWSPMGEGLPGAVSEFIEFQGTLYAAGRIDDDESDETAFGMARWTGSGWDRLALLGRPGSKYPNIRAMEVFEGELVVGGDFDFVDGQPANNLAVYDGTAFRPFHDDPTGPYPNGTVYDLKAHGGDLYLAGAFTRVGDIASRGIARWQALRPATGLLAGSPAVSRTSDGAEIRWQADPATVGFFSFDVYREDPGTGRVKLTDIPLSGRIDYLVSDPGFTLDATTYWVAELSHDGGVTWHGPLTLPIPALVLRQNRPNPAAASTTIEFESPVDGPVRVRVFDLNGRLVATPFARAVSTGPQQFTWDPRDSHGRPLAAGVYFYRLETPAGERTRKMILVSR